MCTVSQKYVDRAYHRSSRFNAVLTATAETKGSNTGKTIANRLIGVSLYSSLLSSFLL